MKQLGKWILISGVNDSGKTSLCLQIAQLFKKTGWDVSGIVSPAVMNENGKFAIDGLDLRSGERRRFAELSSSEGNLQGPKTLRWQFSQEALDWGNQVLLKATPCDLLIIDEFGPLEFDCGEGLLAGLEANDSRQFKASLTVVRPSLVEKAQNRWPDAEVLNLSSESNISLLAEELIQQILFPILNHSESHPARKKLP